MAHLNYNPLSLKDMAIIRLADVLFKESNILASISNFHDKYPLNVEDWRETVEDKLPDEISKLGLPKSLQKLVIDTAKPVGRQVGRWKQFHEKYLYDSHGEEIHFDVPILEKLRWTAAGAVDYRKTAEELVRSDDIDIVKRYKLACLYCMEDCIPLFWKELPKENKKYFCGKEGPHLQSGGLGLEFWWPYIIEGQESKLDDLTRPYRSDQITFHQYAFQCSAKKGNKTAAEYFFQKLTREEKQHSLMSTTRAVLACQYTIQFPPEKISELLRYLISVMTPDQQMRFFLQEPHELLDCFTVWPSQDMISEIAYLIWDFLPERDRDTVLDMMYWSQSLEDSGHYCTILFQEFFLRIPPDFWEGYVDRQCEFDSYFDNVLCAEDIKALEIFLKSLDAAAKARLVLSEPALKEFHDCISIGKWDVVEVCIREASLSQEDKKRLKEAFMGYLASIGVKEMTLKTRKWTRFFHLLDETNDPSKRCPKETPTETKKRKT
ncbi:hypothetical protein AVEN_7376-1 [Araneus ventricosus]|uniref:Uncharacterized protein n=1 Tax=Araneus ventricosus TaxID=182803 RepID=A0A4Y2BTB8_ARAVE|nr:hypothetical protein AVEN_7376-1 [Araneus ventricosus]